MGKSPGVKEIENLSEANSNQEKIISGQYGALFQAHEEILKLEGKLKDAGEKYNDQATKLAHLEREIDDLRSENERLNRAHRNLRTTDEALWYGSFNESPLKRVKSEFALEQYSKIQDYVLSNKLHMGYDDGASHGYILISEHGYLLTKIQTIRNAAGLRNA
jgi:hypothetical protein